MVEDIDHCSISSSDLVLPFSPLSTASTAHVELAKQTVLDEPTSSEGSCTSLVTLECCSDVEDSIVDPLNTSDISSVDLSTIIAPAPTPSPKAPDNQVLPLLTPHGSMLVSTHSCKGYKLN